MLHFGLPLHALLYPLHWKISVLYLVMFINFLQIFVKSLKCL